MRVGLRYDSLKERIGGALNLVPVPAGYSMYGMATARSLQVAQRTGMLRELALAPAGAADLAERLALREQGTKRLLEVLVASDILRIDSAERFSIAPRECKWLDPASPSYIGGFIEDNYHYWPWWGQLEELVRDGRSVELHDTPPEDPYWDSYIQGQYELARLSSDAVARAVALPQQPRSLLDVAGAHGEFSMALCRRHDGLQATVVDLPGSARVGRQIVANSGMSERVRHLEGDMFEADLGGPHDGALLFNIIHHLSPEQARRIFARIAQTLKPGAPLCVLDLYDRAPGTQPQAGSYLGLFFHLTSGADTYSQDEVAAWLKASGLQEPKRKTLPQLPGLALLRAPRPANP